MSESVARIIVGIDGSETSRTALRWAVGAAQARNMPLEIVHTWQMIYPVEPMAGVGAVQFTPQELAAEAQRLLDETVAELVPPTVSSTRTLLEGPAGKTLVEHAKGSPMLVIGRHGHHGLLAALLGSVAEHVVHHATCPVVTVPS